MQLNVWRCKLETVRTKSCNKWHKFDNNKRPDPCGCFCWGQTSHLANAVRRNACGRWTVGWCLGSPRVRWVWGRLHLQLQREDKAVLVNHMVRKKMLVCPSWSKLWRCRCLWLNSPSTEVLAIYQKKICKIWRLPLNSFLVGTNWSCGGLVP